MSWSVNDILNFTKWLTKKNQSGGISASDLFYAWNSEQRAYQNDLLGHFNAQSNGKTGANIGLIQDKTILQKLAPFTIPETLTISSGNADKPSNFLYALALRINGFDVIPINHNQKAFVNNSVIDPPSVADNKYYVSEYEDYYSFLPSTVTAASLDYIKEPQDIKWGYDIDDDGRQVYNSGLSKQPQWDTNSIIEITRRTLKSIGIHFKDGDFAQYGQSNIQSGN